MSACTHSRGEKGLHHRVMGTRDDHVGEQTWAKDLEAAEAGLGEGGHRSEPGQGDDLLEDLERERRSEGLEDGWVEDGTIMCVYVPDQG